MSGRVYVLRGHFSYEGFSILGVFTREEEATSLKDRLTKARETSWGYDWYDVEAWELDVASKDVDDQLARGDKDDRA